MGINKFLDDAEEIKVTNKNYKKKANEELKSKFETEENLNLLSLQEEVKDKKIAMSIYFREEDLKLLKATSKVKKTTVNKTVMNILEPYLNATRNNLPESFNINKLANEYDKNSKNRTKKNKSK